MNQQEQWWAGEAGNAYIERNQVNFASRLGFWNKVISLTKPSGVLEVGCNVGHNLEALRQIMPSLFITGIDVNEAAIKAVMDRNLDAMVMSARDIPNGDLPPECADLVITAGVLIHIPPDEIKAVMSNIATVTGRCICCVEYHADAETEVTYRGEEGLLWKRPYGDMYQALGFDLLMTGDLGTDEGFGDGCTYWILEKQT